MGYKDILKKYKSGELNEGEKAKIEEEIEKVEAINEYLNDKIDEELFGTNKVEEYNLDEMGKEQDELTININKAINNKLKKYAIIVASSVVTFIMFIYIILSPIMNLIFYNPAKEIKVNNGSINQIAIPIFAYMDLHSVDRGFIYKPKIEKEGFGKYQITLETQLDSHFEKRTATIKRGRLVNEGDYGFLYLGSGMKWGTFSFNRQVGSDYKSEDRAREIFDDLKPTTKVKVAISFKNNITVKELCDYMKKYDKVGFFYAPVKISEVGYQGYTGITLGRSGYGMTNFYDKEKYPYLDLLQYDGVDIPPEIYEEHFMTLLNYMNDQKKFNKVIRSYFDYESIVSYVEQYGIYSYGVVVKGTVEEVKKLMEDENYDDIFVLDTWLTSYTN